MKNNYTTSPADVDPLGCAEMTIRLILAAALLCACVPVSLSLTACTYNRNAPLFSAPLINATGNTTTVPLVGQ
jgi:hypothetical protein